MRKLFMMLLIVLLIINGTSVSMTNALAIDYEPTVFEMIYCILTLDDLKEYIGKPAYYTSDESSGICWTFFDAEYGTISLVGEDIYGKPHCYFWNNLDTHQVLYVCELLCYIWDDLKEIADLYGHGLAFDVYYGDNKGQYIFGKDDVNAFLGLPPI